MYCEEERGDCESRAAFASSTGTQRKCIHSFGVQSLAWVLGLLHGKLLVDGVTASVGGVFILWQQLAPTVVYSWEGSCQTLHIFVAVKQVK